MVRKGEKGDPFLPCGPSEKAYAVRDVGIKANRIALRGLCAKLFQAAVNLRPKHQSGEPGRILREQRPKLVAPLLGETLRREPHPRFRMILAQALRLLLQ